MSLSPSLNARHPWAAALVTSQLAGLIMAVVVMLVFTLFLGKGPLYPVQVIGSAVFGENALVGFNFAAFLAGLVLHQGVALVWGIPFAVAALALGVATPRASALLGVAIAVASMVDAYFVVPALMTSLHGSDIWNREVPIFWDWAAHLVYGASYVLYPLVREKLDAN